MANKTAKTKIVVKKTVQAKAKAPVKKAVVVRKIAHKAAAKAVKPVAKVPAPKRAVPSPAKTPVAPKRPLKPAVDKKGLAGLKDALIKMRDRLTGQISALADDSLKSVSYTHLTLPTIYSV